MRVTREKRAARLMAQLEEYLVTEKRTEHGGRNHKRQMQVTAVCHIAGNYENSFTFQRGPYDERPVAVICNDWFK